MFLPLFREVPDRRGDETVEQLDLDTLRARIGAEAPRSPEHRPDPLVRRFDARLHGPRRTWRDARRSR